MLSVIRPHWSREAFGIIKIVACGLLLAYGFRLAVSYDLLTVMPGTKLIVLSSLLALTLGVLWLNHNGCKLSKLIITDRRVIRFEGVIRGWENRRSLFWSEITKTRTKSPNLLLRLAKVGTIEIVPNFDAQNESIYVPYMYMYGDLAAYLDKISFTFKTRPAEMEGIREFVALPKGQRYPMKAAA